MSTAANAQPITWAQSRSSVAAIMLRIDIRVITFVAIISNLPCCRRWIPKRRWRHKLSFNVDCFWLGNMRNVLLHFFTFETNSALRKIMSATPITVPVPRSRAVCDRRWIRRLMERSKIRWRRRSFRDLRLRNSVGRWTRCNGALRENGRG